MGKSIWSRCPEAYLYSFAFAFVLAPLTWNVVVFVVYIVLMEIVFWITTDTAWTPVQRVGAFFFAFYGWMCGRLWFGDETPLRTIKDIHKDEDKGIFYKESEGIIDDCIPSFFS